MRFGVAAARWVIAARLNPRCVFECIDRPSPNVPQIPASFCDARKPPQKWWSDRMICTAPWAMPSGTSSNDVTHMFVASGRLAEGRSLVTA